MKLLITRLFRKNICAWHDGKRLIQVTTEEYDSRKPMIGDIYNAKVKNLVNNINACFVQIDNGQLCFFQLNELKKKSINREMEVIVQITKEGYRNKQPSVTDAISITGRYLILTTKNEISISNKIKNVMKRKELIQWLDDESDTNGFIIRTNALNASKEQILREKEYLLDQYKRIVNKSQHGDVFCCIYKAPSDYLCAVRDSYDTEIDQIITDIPSIYQEIQAYTNDLFPEMTNKLVMYKDDSYSMSALYGIETGIEKALSNKVWLKSGAYIIFDVTEACTVIDVNTGKAIHGKLHSESTFFNINKEAAEEIMLQLRLRNISGIIIIDFIDMKEENNINELLRVLKELALLDPLKTIVVDITKLGLVEITRKKSKKSLQEQLSNRFVD